MTDPKPKRRKPETPLRHRRDDQGLLEKERAFVLHYIGACRGNAAQAALKAGYGREGATTVSIRRYAHEVLKRPQVIAEIDRLREARNVRLEVSADDVLRELVEAKTDAALLPRSIQSIRLRHDVLKTIGDHIGVGAFRKQFGLAGPTGGPIETVDHAALAKLSDEELDQLERANAIIDRLAGNSSQEVPDVGDQSGAGAAPEGE